MRLVVSGEMADDHLKRAGGESSEITEGLAGAIETAVRDVTKLRGDVQPVNPWQPAQRRQGD